MTAPCRRCGKPHPVRSEEWHEVMTNYYAPDARKPGEPDRLTRFLIWTGALIWFTAFLIIAVTVGGVRIN